MKRTSVIILILFLLTSCSHKKDIPELLRGTFRSHFVSFNETKPIINLDEGRLKEMLILLHHRVPEDNIKNHFNMNDSTWNDKINYLFGQGLIKKSEKGNYLPTFFVLDDDNSSALKKFTDSLGVEMSGIALDRLAKIKAACAIIPSLKNFTFDDISLFVLGSVMHDYWQQKYYQDQFIKSFVPHRGNADYYFAIFQSDINSVKIFETKFYEYPSFQFGSYCYAGNEFNLATFPTSILKNNFGREETEDDYDFQIKLLNDLIGLSKNHFYKVKAKHMEGFEKFGMVANGKTKVPYIINSDKQKLYNAASVITADLINYFESRQTLFVKRYLSSQYREETNYKEWMVWIYKIITTSAVEELIKKSIIKANTDRTAAFIIQK